jgi:MoaA/NifB/PqqE/SkfB family radical SAM enzyme
MVGRRHGRQAVSPVHPWGEGLVRSWYRRALIGLSHLPTAGLPCRTGESVISVDGSGTVRRCHFVPAELGNLYDGSYRRALRPRTCPLAACDCHIGYVPGDAAAL